MNSEYDNQLKEVFSLTEKRKYLDAHELVDQVLESNPNWYKPYDQKAKVYARQGKWAEAVESVGDAIELEPKNSALYFSRARWLIQCELFSDAYNDLTQIISLESILSDSYYLESAYFFRALTSSYLGNYRDVILNCEYVRDDYVTHILKKLHSKKELLENAKRNIN